MHTFAPLLYSYMLAPTCFGSSLPSSGSFWIRLSYVKIQIDMVVYHITWLSGLCVGVSWFSPIEPRHCILCVFACKFVLLYCYRASTLLQLNLCILVNKYVYY
jgi:hypothetical protein